MIRPSFTQTFGFYGHPYEDVSDLLAAFKVQGIDDIKEMIKLVEDTDSTLMAFKAQALTAEAKLNRIKNLLKD